ncbi:MAG: glycoside hydrolase family 3 N-terminal domain-containing protein [Bacteroidota bacterium]
MKVKQVLIIVLIGLIGCKASQPVVTVSSPSSKTNPSQPTPPPPAAKPAAGIAKAQGTALSAEDSLDLKIGQMIMVGVNDRTTLPVSDPLRKEIGTYKIGGILLFEKNIAKANQKETLKKLVADLQAAAPFPLFMGIDEEGGRVHRLKEKYGFIKIPSAAYLGSLPNTDSTTFYNRSLAALLAELGFTLNFAPTVDVAVNPHNPVIVKAERSFSSNPTILSQHAAAAITAHDEYGIITVLKHFPGHGSSSTDSHQGITDVTRQWQWQELFPYKDLIRAGKAQAILSSHVINCRLDSSCLPASLSKVMNTDLLRNLLDFKGVIFTDDMQMQAISNNYGLEKAVKLSVLSGVDVLVYGNTVNASNRVTATQLHNILKKAVKSGEITEARINESYHRIIALKQKKVQN